MPKKNNQKLRLLYMKDILEQHTDEGHGISLKDFERYLSHKDVEAPTRKTFYDDLDALEDYGMDLGRDPYGKSYKLLSRDFELPYIKLIIDAKHEAIPKKHNLKKLSFLFKIFSCNFSSFSSAFIFATLLAFFSALIFSSISFIFSFVCSRSLIASFFVIS